MIDENLMAAKDEDNNPVISALAVLAIRHWYCLVGSHPKTHFPPISYP